MRHELVILDLDGTLADSAEWFIATLNEIANRFGFRTVGAAEIAELRGRRSAEIIRYLRVPKWKLPAIARHMRRRSEAAAGGIALFPGMADLVAALHAAGVRIGIVSSNSEVAVRTILGPATASLVDHYACGSSLFGKARKMRRVVAESGVSTARAIAVGDEPRDIEAAHRAGIAGAAVLWGYADERAFAGLQPLIVAGTVADLRAALLP